MHESEKWKWSRSVVSYSSRPHGLQPTRLLRPWDFPGRSTGMGCHCLLWLLFSIGIQIGNSSSNYIQNLLRYLTKLYFWLPSILTPTMKESKLNFLSIVSFFCSGMRTWEERAHNYQLQINLQFSHFAYDHWNVSFFFFFKFQILFKAFYFLSKGSHLFKK